MKSILIILCLSLVYTIDINLACDTYNTTHCVSCSPYYFLDTTLSQCQLCEDLIPGCLTCSSLTTSQLIPNCSLCQDGYDLVSNTVGKGYYCVSCPDGMFYNSAGQCETCKNVDTTTLLDNCKRCPRLELSLLSVNATTSQHYITCK